MKRTRKVVSKRRVSDDRVRDMGEEPRWFCFQMQPQLRETAAHNLTRQNFEPFFPSILLTRGKRSWTEPMFRGYGFVRFNPAIDRWRSINGTYGVSGLLPRHSLYPMPMPVGLIERLLANDPCREEDFLAVFDEYYPGVTQVEVTDDHKLLSGRRGVYLDRRGGLLQVAFYRYDTGGTGPAVWIEGDYVRPAAD